MQSIRPVLKSELADVFQLEQVIFGDHCYPDFFFRQGFDCWPEYFLVAIDEPLNINSAMKTVEFIYNQLLSICMAKGGDIIAGGTVPDH